MAARTVGMGGFDYTSTNSTVSVGSSGDYNVGTLTVQITIADGALTFQGTLGDPATGTYATLGYTTIADPSTVVTTGIVSASGIYRVFGDGLSDVRLKVSSAGTTTPVILVRPVDG